MIAIDNSVRERRTDNTRHEWGSNSDPRLRVTVVVTTGEATIAALRTAGELASSLAARMTLVAIEVVPFRLPLGQPSVPVEFLKRRLLALVSDSGVDAEEVSIEICFCRERKNCLQRMLHARSLVVVGGNRGWCSQEQRLCRFLGSFGHQVMFVHVSRARSARVLRRFMPQTFAKRILSGD